MIVQEAGMAVGWPLGLGHDTTGWPLGLRLRLTQEDLQWPREPHLDDSPSYSTNSSSLDTESTRSFFQDKSISLGTLIGLPINHYPAANNNNINQQAQRRRRNSNSMLRVFPTSTSSGSRCGSEGHHNQPLRNKSRSSGRNSSHGSNRPTSKSAASAGWTLLSVLSCARVPSNAATTIAEGGSRSSKSSSRSGSHSHGGSEHSTSNPPAAGGGENHPNHRLQTAAGPESQQRLMGLHQFANRSPPASKLYDNITFEEDGATDHDDSHSSEWNPLFASSSLEEDDDEEVPDVVPESLEHVQSQMRSHSSFSDSQASDWSSASESFDQRNSGSKSSSNNPRDLSSQFGKHSAIHMLISRMVCCRSTPTVDS